MKTLTFLLLAFSLNCFSQIEEEFFNSGIKKNKAGDYQGAIEDYTKALEINPKNSYSYYNRGNSKSKLKDYLGAIEDFTKAIEINPP
jgi:tetratricopeptide (TPR) repeat protein